LRLDSRLRDLILQAPKHKRMERNRVWIPELAFEATKRGTKQALNNKVFFFSFSISKLPLVGDPCLRTGGAAVSPPLHKLLLNFYLTLIFFI
jgi:hypothetical protein